MKKRGRPRNPKKGRPRSSPDNYFKKIREKAGISFGAACTALNIKESSLYNIESGRRNVSRELAEKMSSLYGKSVEEILCNSRGMLRPLREKQL